MVKTIAHPKTCPNCGYDMNNCICGHHASDGSQRRRFSYFEDFRKKKDSYALTNYDMQPNLPAEVKHFIEIFPVHGEEVWSWIQRTKLHAREITEHSRYYHTRGTSKPWPSHSSGRYCPMCTTCDFIDILCILADNFLKLFPRSKLVWAVETGPTLQQNHYTIEIVSHTPLK